MSDGIVSGQGVHVDYEQLNEVLQGSENSVDGIHTAHGTITKVSGDLTGAIAGVELAALVSITNDLTTQWAHLSNKAATDGATVIKNARKAAKAIGDVDQKLATVVISGSGYQA